MKKWKKVVLWIVSILALLAVIVGGAAIYLVQKNKKEEVLVNSAYKKLIPNDIDSYPELKNYYYNLYLQGLIEEKVSISPYEDPIIPMKISFVSKFHLRYSFYILSKLFYNSKSRTHFLMKNPPCFQSSFSWELQFYLFWL